jgi:hypothetical protein
LEDLSALAPDLKAFFRDLGPMIDASVKGFPAAERVLQDLRPLLGQLDPALRQLNPVLDFIGLYKPELTAFFANTVAATQATTVGSKGPIHYLRTTNPLNPENLAVYPKRLPTNRPNPYTLPGVFNQLRQGLPSYETRQCTNGPIPTIDNVPTQVIPPTLPDLGVPVPAPVPDAGVVDGLFSYSQSLINDVVRFAFPNGMGSTGIAPPCKQQGKFNFSGEQTQFPHVKSD